MGMKTLVGAAPDWDPEEWENKWWQALKDSLDNAPEVWLDTEHERTDHPTPPPHGTD